MVEAIHDILILIRHVSDHPIHPPVDGSDPWDLEFPPDKEYCIKAVDGVFNIFEDKVS